MEKEKKVEKVSLNKKDGLSATNPFDFATSKKFKDTGFQFAPKRLNDYDSQILDKQSYKELDSTSAKLQYQISETEKQLAELREKIKGAERIAKVNEVLDLKIREKGLEKELEQLNKSFQEQGLKPKINRAIRHRGDAFFWILKLQRYVSRKILPKFSKKFYDISQLSSSLETLSSINANIDELIEMKVPYGEYKQSYEKLTSYLNRANKIHSQISKSMGKL